MCQLLCNWIWVNMIFKSYRSQMFYKTGVVKVLENSHKSTCNYVKKRLQLRCFYCEFCKFFKNTFGRLLLDFFQWTNRNQVFSIFEHVSLRLSNVINIINFAIEKLHLAKLTRASFLMKLHAKGLQLYWKKTYVFNIIFRNPFHRILANSFFWNGE